MSPLCTRVHNCGTVVLVNDEGTTVKTHILINEADGNFFGYKPEHADKLKYVTAFTQPDDRGDITALEMAFQVGNSADPESDVLYYNHGVRSISVGDVILIERNGAFTGFACASLGWEPVDVEALPAAVLPV